MNEWMHAWMAFSIELAEKKKRTPYLLSTWTGPDTMLNTIEVWCPLVLWTISWGSLLSAPFMDESTEVKPFSLSPYQRYVVMCFMGDDFANYEVLPTRGEIVGVTSVRINLKHRYNQSSNVEQIKLNWLFMPIMCFFIRELDIFI